MDRFVSLHEVERITSLHKSQIYAMMKAGDFPRGFQLSTRRRAWRASELEAWMNTRRRN